MVMSLPLILLSVVAQLVVIATFPEPLQSCLTDIAALNSIRYYITLCRTFSVSSSL